MIDVQFDVLLDPSDDDTTAIWSGMLPEIPQVGATVEIREGDHEGLYRVAEPAHWIVVDPHTISPVAHPGSVIVIVETVVS